MAAPQPFPVTVSWACLRRHEEASGGRCAFMGSVVPLGPRPTYSCSKRATPADSVFVLSLHFHGGIKHLGCGFPAGGPQTKAVPTCVPNRSSWFQETPLYDDARRRTTIPLLILIGAIYCVPVEVVGRLGKEQLGYAGGLVEK